MFFYERLNNSQFECFWDISQDKLALQKTTEQWFSSNFISYETNSVSAKAAHYPTHSFVLIWYQCISAVKSIFLLSTVFSWIRVRLYPNSFRLRCRKARSRRTIRCWSSWTAGVSRWLWRAWRRASIACWRPTTPSWWSPPPSSSSRNATATWRWSAAWSTPRRTASGRPWVK